MSDPSNPSKRPRSVLVAVFAQTLFLAVTLYRVALLVQWQHLVAWFVYACIVIAFSLWARGLFGRRRWAYLLTLWWNGLGLLGWLLTWRETPAGIPFFIQAALQFVSLVALLLPGSRRWYSKLSCWPNQALERTDLAE
jgi:hypothetical protein